jgi:ABC-type phosphate transport system substrate-binding protein
VRCGIGRLLFATGLALALGRPAAAAEGFVVVAHPAVFGASVHREDLAGVFLRKVPRWGDQTPAVPVDQSGASPVRKAFTEAVLQMGVSTALQYWQKQLFATPPVRPPLVKGSDAEVLAFVGATPGAVGYVAPGAILPPTVKQLAVID